MAKSVSRRQALALATAGLLTVRPAFGDELAAFRDEVLDVARRRVPGLPLTKTDDIEELRSGHFRFYLGNLRATVRGLVWSERETEIVKWLKSLEGQTKGPSEEEKAAEAWLYAKPRLRPKLVPADYLEQAKIMVHRPFLPDIVIGYGIDLGRIDTFVTAARLAKWAVPLDEVHAVAIANLEDMSKAIAIEPKHPPRGAGVYAAGHKGDAYDASRVLLPGFRARLVAALGGSRAFAGIPNRDFLIAWSPDFSGRDRFMARIREDVRTQPYSLTDRILVLTPGEVRAATPDELR